MFRVASHAESVFVATCVILFAAPAAATPIAFQMLPPPKEDSGLIMQGPQPAPSVNMQTFHLHSNPGSNHVIYLDFDGHTTSGTPWNNFYNGGSDFTTPAYTIDADPFSFNSDERTEIQHIWQRVAEDYIPFGVDVTTATPGPGYLQRTPPGDSKWGMRVVIGGSPSQWYNRNAGGVAFLGSFTWGNDTPAYVFTDYGSYSVTAEGFVAEAASHETGHTLGLDHDSQRPGDGEYYAGRGGWAPIMGVSYYKPLTQWSKGEYVNATNKEDDLAIIASDRNGFGFRPDDHGDLFNLTGPTLLSPSGNGSGIISKPADRDLFKFDHGGGNLAIDIDNSPIGANLDIGAKLYRWNSDSWSFMFENDPAASLDASFSGLFQGGIYLLAIDGVGFGDPFTNGYSGYGSLGQYTIHAELAPVSVPEPGTLALLALGGAVPLTRRRNC